MSAGETRVMTTEEHRKMSFKEVLIYSRGTWRRDFSPAHSGAKAPPPGEKNGYQGQM